MSRILVKAMEKILCTGVFITIIKIAILCSIIVGQLNKLWHIQSGYYGPVAVTDSS